MLFFGLYRLCKTNWLAPLLPNGQGPFNWIRIGSLPLNNSSKLPGQSTDSRDNAKLLPSNSELKVWIMEEAQSKASVSDTS